MKKLRRFLRLSFSDRYVLVKAVLLVGLIRLGLKAIPFRHLLSWLHRCAGASRGKRAVDSWDKERALWAVSAAARHLLGERPCLTQALAVQLLLRRHGYPAELRIGVAKDEQGTLRAHAWVESEEQVIIGGTASPDAYEAFPSMEFSRWSEGL